MHPDIRGPSSHGQRLVEAVVVGTFPGVVVRILAEGIVRSWGCFHDVSDLYTNRHTQRNQLSASSEARHKRRSRCVYKCNRCAMR